MFLRRVLAEGAARLGVTLAGGAVFGWRDRTIGSAALRGGLRYWVRATAEHRDWARGEVWTGTRDALVITGVPKPRLVDRVEWEDPPVVIGAELMTYVPAAPCSPTAELRQTVDLPEKWWGDLRSAMDRLAAHPTRRGDHDAHAYLQELADTYGRPLDLPVPVMRTEHTDLHWANVTAPELWILDWEYWGSAPAGMGAAMLYLHSLLVPAMAARVREAYADLLDSPSGRVAQLAAGAHILSRSYRVGDYAELQHPVRAHVRRLLGDV